MELHNSDAFCFLSFSCAAAGKNLPSKLACIQLINYLIAPGHDGRILSLEQRLSIRAKFAGQGIDTIFEEMLELHLGAKPELYLKMVARIARYHKLAGEDLQAISKRLPYCGA